MNCQIHFNCNEKIDITTIYQHVVYRLVVSMDDIISMIAIDRAINCCVESVSGLAEGEIFRLEITLAKIFLKSSRIERLLRVLTKVFLRWLNASLTTLMKNEKSYGGGAEGRLGPSQKRMVMTIESILGRG